MPIPDVAHSYREDSLNPGYWFYGDLRIQADVESHQFVNQYVREHLSPGSRILDVGAGEGALAQQLLDAGMCVSVTSWNEKCSLQIPIYHVDCDKDFSLDAVGGDAYDMVCCIEIIEHLENPARFLRDCRRLVKPEGIIILSTPNVESAQARLQWLLRGYPLIFGEGEIRKNRHISMMWGKGLEHFAELASLRIIEKHLLGRFNLKPGFPSVLKKFLFMGMHLLLKGDTRGTTRLYVLKPTKNLSRHHGPEDVY